MNWLGIGIAVVAAYAGFRMISLLLRMALWAVALLALYWVCAPLMGWPTLSELIRSPPPALEAARIDEVVRNAERAGGRAVDLAGDALEQANDVAEQVRERLGSDIPTGAPPDAGQEQSHASESAAQETDQTEARQRPPTRDPER